MADSKGKPSIDKFDFASKQFSGDFSNSKESHQMTLNQPFGEKEVAESISCSTEYHLTIQITNSSLSIRDQSLLLDVLNYQAVNFGVNLNMMLGMYELYFRILGNKREASEVREPRIRLTLTVSELIFKYLKGIEFGLDSRIVVLIPSKLKNLLSKGLMTKRTYGSRFRTWRPEKFLRVRIVPVDIQFLKRNKDTQPYSSYTKGYGESHPSAHRQKLKPSADYDGSGEDPLSIEETKLFERCMNPIHNLSNFMLISYEWYELEEK